MADDKNDIVVFFDLDGVLADFDRHANEQGKYDENGKLKWDELDYAWWTTMPPCKDAKAFYDEVSGQHTTKFLTAPVLSEECFSGKANWVGTFTGKGKFALKELIICPSKDKHFLVRPSHILIDDRESNVREWREAGGIAIHHTGDFAQTRTQLDAAIEQLGKPKEAAFAAKIAVARQSPGSELAI